MKRTWFWVYQIFEGRPIILGPLDSEAEGNRWGFEKMKGDFKVVELPTADMGNATRMIKAKILEETSDLEQSLRRASHGEIPRPFQNYEGD